MKQMLSIIYEDEYLVAINKPHGLLVHRSSIAQDTDEYALQILRDQIGCYLYPIHRLDRKTAGVLVFAKSKEIASALGKTIMEGRCAKVYHAIVRGFFPVDKLELDYSLTDYRGRRQEAVTHFQLIKHYEIDVPFGDHLTSRYSLVEARPKTGRYHQIRKHLAHLRHPIIADRPHGCNKQNRLWKQTWQMTTMLLQATELSITHPVSEDDLNIHAPYSTAMQNVIEGLSGISDYLLLWDADI